MQHKITMQDIANIAGVSKSTVSNYINYPNTNKISMATKERIQAALDQTKYGYQKSRHIIQTGQRTICCVFPRPEPALSSAFLSQILAGVQLALTERNCNLMIPPASGLSTLEIFERQLKLCGGQQGIILFGSRYLTEKDTQTCLELLANSRIPYVCVNFPPLTGSINQVIINRNGIVTALTTLIQLGHRNIGLMIGRALDAETLAILNLYRSTLEKYDIPCEDVNILNGDFTYQGAMEAFLTRCNTRNNAPLSAIICLSDIMAAGVYDAARQLGIAIPGKLSVIAQNESPFRRLFSPPLSTIQVHLEEIGKKAVEILFQSIESGHIGYRSYVDGDFVLHDSVSTYE